MSSEADSDSEAKDNTNDSTVANWSSEEFSSLLPHIFQVAGNISFPYRSVCWNWYKSIWKGLYTKPLKLHIRHFPENNTWTISLENTQKLLGPLFWGHLKNLEILVLDNYYVTDDDLAKLILDNVPSKIHTISMRLLQNHSEITERGISRIATCQNLHTLTLTVLGGNHFFHPCHVTLPMMEIISKVTTLTTLEISIFDISALPPLTKMTQLTSLTLCFQKTTIDLEKSQFETQERQTEFFSALAKNLTNLKHLAILRASGDLNGICEGFDNVESFNLGYGTTNVSLVAPWKGKHLKKLVIQSTKSFSFDSFFNNERIKHVEITNPFTWANLSNFLSHNGRFLDYLKIGSPKLTKKELTEVAQLCPQLSIIHSDPFVVITDENEQINVPTVEGSKTATIHLAPFRN